MHSKGTTIGGLIAKFSKFNLLKDQPLVPVPTKTPTKIP